MLGTSGEVKEAGACQSGLNNAGSLPLSRLQTRSVFFLQLNLLVLHAQFQSFSGALMHLSIISRTTNTAIFLLSSLQDFSCFSLAKILSSTVTPPYHDTL